jgi:hypothetical protein
MGKGETRQVEDGGSTSSFFRGHATIHLTLHSRFEFVDACLEQFEGSEVNSFLSITSSVFSVMAISWKRASWLSDGKGGSPPPKEGAIWLTESQLRPGQAQAFL